MENIPPCPACQCLYAYAIDEKLICPECGHEWEVASDVKSQENGLVVVDAHGTPLANGDSVVVIKNLPVKGSPKPIKGGTKVKNIRLTEGDHNIDCKIEGFGSIALKSEFVKKAGN
jgi:protein PhnA